MNNGKSFRQIMVPSPFRRQLMEVASGPIMGGYRGVKKTTDKILSAFYRPGI